MFFESRDCRQCFRIEFEMMKLMLFGNCERN
jgi:hypothetical protein